MNKAGDGSSRSKRSSKNIKEVLQNSLWTAEFLKAVFNVLVVAVLLVIGLVATRQLQPMPAPSLQKKGTTSREQILPSSRRHRFLIYFCQGRMTCGGWGDRQYGILSAYLIANATGRKLGIHMKKPCSLSRYFLPNKINWTVPDSDLRNLSKKHVEFSTRASVTRIRTIDFDKVYPQEAVYLSTNYGFQEAIRVNPNYQQNLRWMRNMTGENVFRKVHRDLFVPAKSLLTRLASFDEKSKSNSYKLVCAQIRIGKNPSMPNDDRRNSISSVQVVWEFLQRFNDSSKYRIFVTTDAEEIRKKAKRLFPRQVLDTKGKIIHIDKHTSGSPVFCQALEKTFLDQMILTSCEVLLVSRSNFGQNAVKLKEEREGSYLFKNGNITQLY